MAGSAAYARWQNMESMLARWRCWLRWLHGCAGNADSDVHDGWMSMMAMLFNWLFLLFADWLCLLDSYNCYAG
jgi:hypothetical protein